ncbi:MAG: TOBE domain-containing protein [Halobacteriaceae archaeon]
MTGDATVEPRIESGDVAFGPADADLLWAVDEQGSLNAAAAALGRSFAHAQRRVVALEDAFGALLERTRGGPSGGGSDLTDAARELLARFDRLRAAGEGVVDVERTVLAGTVVERDGELGAVETPLGRLRALVPPAVESVSVSVRSDAVTLQDPAESPAAGETSALNRFCGRVVDVDAGADVAVVTVAVGTADLSALVTRESVARLGLAPGVPVAASFKATATRAVPVRRDGVD